MGTPDAGAFWKIISDYKIKTMFTAPTAFRAIKKEDSEGKFFSKYDLSKFKALFLAGERADPDTIHWAEDLLKKPVIDHWWQTETSWAISSILKAWVFFQLSMVLRENQLLDTMLYIKK